MKKKILANFLVFCLILLFSEFFVRYFNLAVVVGTSKNLFNHDKTLNFNNKNVEAITFGKPVFTDNNGFRIPNRDYDYKKNLSSILILGDSTTFGVGVEEELSFIGLLRNYKKNINLYNAAIAGHSLRDFNLVISEFEFLESEKIFIFLNINDIHFPSGIVTRTEEEKYKKNKYLSFIEKIKNQKDGHLLRKINFFLRSKSALYMYLKSVLSNPQQRYFELIYPYYLNEQNTSHYKQYLKEIKNVSSKVGKEIIFFILPYEYQTRENNCEKKLLLPQRKIKKYLDEIKFNYYDFTHDFCNFHKPKKLYLPFDPTHLSKEGHKFVYNLLNENPKIFKFK